jgi:hypothetical protein
MGKDAAGIVFFKNILTFSVKPIFLQLHLQRERLTTIQIS